MGVLVNVEKVGFLTWFFRHCSGNYCKGTKTGGSNGGIISNMWLYIDSNVVFSI